jgi:hypothetical protein
MRNPAVLYLDLSFFPTTLRRASFFMMSPVFRVHPAMFNNIAESTQISSTFLAFSHVLILCLPFLSEVCYNSKICHPCARSATANEASAVPSRRGLLAGIQIVIVDDDGFPPTIRGNDRVLILTVVTQSAIRSIVNLWNLPVNLFLMQNKIQGILF